MQPVNPPNGSTQKQPDVLTAPSACERRHSESIIKFALAKLWWLSMKCSDSPTICDPVNNAFHNKNGVFSTTKDSNWLHIASGYPKQFANWKRTASRSQLDYSWLCQRSQGTLWSHVGWAWKRWARPFFWKIKTVRWYSMMGPDLSKDSVLTVRLDSLCISSPAHLHGQCQN